MISTISTSLHALVATLILSVAILIFLAGPRKRENRAIGSILILYSLASVAFAMSVNSVSVQQAIPWAFIEIMATYSSAPAALLVAISILRPKVTKNPYVTIPLWIFILIPPIISILDLTNISQTFFSTPLLFSIDKLTLMYSGGYISIQDATTTVGKSFLLLELIFFYTIWIFYPNLYVMLKDRKSDRFNSINARVLFLSSVFGSIAIFLLQSNLPTTIAPLITNVIISLGFFVVWIRLIRGDKKDLSADSLLQLILKNYPMFSKLAITIGLIVIPAIIFITFTSFSFFQNSLLTVANQNLMVSAQHGADSTIEKLNQEFHTIEHLTDGNNTRALLAYRDREYANLTDEQIIEDINNKNNLWTRNDQQLISTTIEPVKNLEFTDLIEENPHFVNIYLIDPHGGLITGSDRPPMFNFSGEPSWQFVLEEQKPFIGQVVWNDPIQGYLLEIAYPIFNADSKLIGLTISDLDITDIITSLQKFEQNNIKFGLANSNGRIIPSSGLITGEFNVPVFALNTQMSEQEWETFQINEQSFLIQSSLVSGDEFDFQAPWIITAYQPVSQALAPLRTATLTAAITALIIITISTLIIISLSQSIARPLSKLTDAAKRILEGDTQVTLQVDSADEIGTLATSFNQMSTDLNNLLSNLENTIEDRTKDLQKRALQLEASAVVARQAAEVKDVASLLDLVVSLIPDKFNYYHAGIFLLDEHNRFAVLQASNSEGGKKMLARNHKLQVGRVGVVGYAAGMGQPRIAQNVGTDIVYYDNPDMPNTRSEMALPLKVRERVIGVLDVQSTEENAFSQDDIEVLQVLADQLALAIDNARLLESSQQALEELQILYGRDTTKAWRQRLTGREIGFTYDSTGLIKEITEPKISNEDPQKLLSKPISLRGQVIGNLNFIREGQDSEWSEDETILIEEILEQTALALENARLVNQIRLRSDQIQLLQEITAMAASVLDEKELLENVAQKLQSSLHVQHCGIALLDEDQEYVELVTSASPKGTDIKLGSKIRVEEDTITQKMIQNPGIFRLIGVEGEPEYQTFIQSFTSKQGTSLTFMPLTNRDQVAGYIYLENQDMQPTIDQEEENLFRQISAQISTALESARLFAAEQKARIAAAALLEITQIASSSLDMNQVLNQATNRSAQAIQAHRCTIFLLDEKEKIKPLIGIYSDGSEMSDGEWDLLKKRVHDTYEHFPLHRLAANLRKPLIISDPLTYPNFPLYWTEDFNIKNMLMVPLISQNKVIGSMIFDQINPNLTFKQNQVELAQTIAGQIATTIENANLFEQAVHRAERERQVTEITAKIRSTNDPQKIMETAITELRIALAQTSGKAKRKSPNQPTPQQPNSPTNGKDEEQN